MIDKRAVWATITAMVEEAVGDFMFHTLVKSCWLDSLEGDTATIAVESDTLAGIIRRKALKALQFAFSEYKGTQVKVRIVLGAPRIHVDPPKNATVTDITSSRGEQDELAILHQKYGDIMGIVDHHPVFKKATTAIDKNGWGIFPQLLTNACKDYGVLTVLKGLRYTANRPSVANPRAFFFSCLKKGQFGHRLAIGADMVGPVAEADQGR